MKVCIPTETGLGREAKVCGHFGSAPFYTIYDTESGRWEIIDNANQVHEHGACNPVAAIQGRGIEAVLCGGMGWRAAQNLAAGGIQAFRTTEATVAEAIQSFQTKNVERISHENACGHHGCHT